jgi:hypothetical protein
LTNVKKNESEKKMLEEDQELRAQVLQESKVVVGQSNLRRYWTKGN